MTDPLTGLLRPQSGARMKSADGHVISIPDEYFLHPQTGRVLPIESNVSYDPITSRLIFTADAAIGAVHIPLLIALWRTSASLKNHW